jgi:Domain of unknown function (DUF4386)
MHSQPCDQIIELTATPRVLRFRSKFFPPILGLLMIVAGATYWINSFRLFLTLPTPYIQWVTLVAELSLAIWLLVVGMNEAKWRTQASKATLTEV